MTDLKMSDIPTRREVDPRTLETIRDALRQLGVVPPTDGIWRDAARNDLTERNIEDLAREWCAAVGIDPDRVVTFIGAEQPVPGAPGWLFMAGTVRPAWTQFLDPAYKFATALGIPVRKADKPGGYPFWISPDSVTEFRAVPMSRDDSSI